MADSEEMEEDFENLYLEIHKKEAEIQNTIKNEQITKLKKISQMKKQYEDDLKVLENSLTENKKKREEIIRQNLQKCLLETDKRYKKYLEQLEDVIGRKKEEMTELITKKLFEM